jgi:hypothetical protein
MTDMSALATSMLATTQIEIVGWRTVHAMRGQLHEFINQHQYIPPRLAFRPFGSWPAMANYPPTEE